MRQWELFKKIYALSVGGGLGCLYLQDGRYAKHDRIGL